MDWPGPAHTYEVVKRNKRMHIACLETDEIVYTPPDFLKLPTRIPLQALAARFDKSGPVIDLIMEFETQWNPRGPVRKH